MLLDIKTLKDWVKSELLPVLEQRHIILLKGPLGAGKTTLVSFFVEACEGSQMAHSPTFAIHHRYDTPKGSIDHIDLYRIRGEDDLETTGFWDIFSQKKGFIFVEWPERLENLSWPKDWALSEITLEIPEEEKNKREVSFKKYRKDKKII